MPLFLRFVDTFFDIWIRDLGGTTWEELKKETSNFEILSWVFLELRNFMDFLDLTILIENNKIVMWPYKKALNLYQYISMLSNHQPKMMDGIIFSLLKNHKNQNTSEKDYLVMALKLFTCHVQQGWSRT